MRKDLSVEITIPAPEVIINDGAQFFEPGSDPQSLRFGELFGLGPDGLQVGGELLFDAGELLNTHR